LLAEQRKDEILAKMTVADASTKGFQKSVMPTTETKHIDDFIETLPAKENKMSQIFKQL